MGSEGTHMSNFLRGTCVVRLYIWVSSVWRNVIAFFMAERTWRNLLMCCFFNVRDLKKENMISKSENFLAMTQALSPETQLIESWLEIYSCDTPYQGNVRDFVNFILLQTKFAAADMSLYLLSSALIGGLEPVVWRWVFDVKRKLFDCWIIQWKME